MSTNPFENETTNEINHNLTAEPCFDDTDNNINGYTINKQTKSSEFNEIDSKQEQNNLIDKQNYDDTSPNCVRHFDPQTLIIYRSQRTTSPRNIKIIKCEERISVFFKTKLKKWSVYTIECDPPIQGVSNVARRFNDFKWLRSRIAAEFPGMFVPPLPQSNFFGRFENEFVEERKYELERFLNRIEIIKPFSESFSFIAFLSWPEEGFDEGTKRLETENPKSISQISTILETIFPNLKTQSLSNETTSTDDVPRLKEFLMKIESQMKILLDLGEKLFNRLSEIQNDVTALNLHFKTLYADEENCPSNLNIKREDIRKPLKEWNQFQKKQLTVYNQYFYRPLMHEYQDVVAFLELFKYRENIQSKWQKAKQRVQKWNEQKDIEFNEKDEQNKNRDIEEEETLASHLQILTKIILHSEIGIVWKEKTETWKQEILKFAQLYAEISQQLTITWKNAKA